MNRLSSLYTSSWTGRGRRAYLLARTKDERLEIKFTADFMRWLSRRMKKEGTMILKRELESEHLLIMVFRKDDCEKSAVRCVAEVILELGEDPAGVSNAAINFAIPGKPLSGGQRFRELCAAYRRQWPGVEPASKFDKWLGLSGVRTHTFRKNRYYFEPLFLNWLKCHINDIERVVFPVTVRRKREK